LSSALAVAPTANVDAVSATAVADPVPFVIPPTAPLFSPPQSRALSSSVNQYQSRTTINDNPGQPTESESDTDDKYSIFEAEDEFAHCGTKPCDFPRFAMLMQKLDQQEQKIDRLLSEESHRTNTKSKQIPPKRKFLLADDELIIEVRVCACVYTSVYVYAFCDSIFIVTVLCFRMSKNLVNNGLTSHVF
jgi:hypothetical protein